MINHKNPKDTLWNYSDELEGFELKSVIKKETNLEIFDSYGIKCNSRFLLNYGFLEENNMHTEYCFKIIVDDTFPLIEEKGQFFSGLSGLKFKFNIGYEHSYENCDDFFSIMRFLAIDNTNDISIAEVLTMY